MSGLMRLVPTALPLSAANLLLFFYWYHLSNAQTKFLRYGEFLAQANRRFIASGFVAGSLVPLGGMGGGMAFRRWGHHPQRVAGRPTAALNTLIVTSSVLLTTQSSNFDPPLWTDLVALVLLLMLNTVLLAAWERLPQIASTPIMSLLVMADYMMSAVGLFVIPIIIFGPKRLALAYSTISLLVAALPAFWILAAGPLGVWRWKAGRGSAHRQPFWAWVWLCSGSLASLPPTMPCPAMCTISPGSATWPSMPDWRWFACRRWPVVALADAMVARRLPTRQATPVE